MNDPNELIPTRLSLLSRLKDWNDQDSWRVFFDTYWRLIYNTAVKAGLTDAEAQDAVQETVISVCKSLRGPAYDASKGSFKTWLLRLTRWRVVSQMRKRQHDIEHRKSDLGTSTRTATVERLADPAAGLALEALWDEEWERNLAEVAIERVKRKVDPKQYQVFDFHVLQNWPVSRVARALKINPGSVYLAKHRISSLIKKEITRLQTTPV